MPEHERGDRLRRPIATLYVGACGLNSRSDVRADTEGGFTVGRAQDIAAASIAHVHSIVAAAGTTGHSAVSHLTHRAALQMAQLCR